MNRDSLVIDHSLFCKKRLIYCTSVFWFVNISPIHHKVLFLKFLELHQLLQCRLYTELFLICSNNFDCLAYHVKYHHSRDEVLQKIYVVSKAFRGRVTESRLIRLIILLHSLIFWSTWALKLSFESKTNLKCFWWAHLEMSLLLNLKDGCDELFELVFREKIVH